LRIWFTHNRRTVWIKPDEIKKIINDGKKRAGFNPDGTPIMSKPYSQPGEKCTDTNQASEDELDTILTLLENSVSMDTSRRMVGGRSGESPKTTHARAKAAIQSLIRTEKLKLLAEIRERELGLDYGDKTSDYLINRSAELKAELTKLEAEL